MIQVSTWIPRDRFLPTQPINKALHNMSLFSFERDRRRSDITGFFTDMQVSSPTTPSMSVKIPNFLHRHSNVGEGS